MRRRVVWPSDEHASKILRSLRIGAKLTQIDIAKRLGCTVSHVSKVELGDQIVSVGEFLAWCDVTETDLNDAFEAFKR